MPRTGTGNLASVRQWMAASFTPTTLSGDQLLSLLAQTDVGVVLPSPYLLLSLFNLQKLLLHSVTESWLLGAPEHLTHSCPAPCPLVCPMPLPQTSS